MLNYLVVFKYNHILFKETCLNKKMDPLKNETPPIPPLLHEAVIHFLRYHPASRVNKNIRIMLLGYLRSRDLELEEMANVLDDVEAICRLLDVAEKNWKEVYE
jgi:hypothetical protein